MDNLFKNIDVLILCGGFGKRLKKLNLKVPKPMARVAGRPFLDMIIAYMAGFGFRRFILGSGYKGDLIKKYYSDQPKKGLKIMFSHEKIPLGTGGGVKNAGKLIKSRSFFVLNGDSFCKFRPGDLLKFHKRKKALATILLKRASGSAKDCGAVEIDGLSQISSFREKKGNAKKCLVNSGIYVFDKKIFDLMPARGKFSLEHDLFPRLTGKGLFGRVSSGYFIDIGTPKRYFEAKKYFTKTHIDKIRSKEVYK